MTRLLTCTFAALLLCNALFAMQQERYVRQFKLEGLVLGYEKDPKKGFLKKRNTVIIEGALQDAEVQVVSGGSTYRETSTGAQGTFSLLLQFDKLYEIIISREGYNETKLFLDLRAIPESFTRKGILYPGVEFILNRFGKGEDPSLDEVLGRLYFNPQTEQFAFEVYGERKVPKNEQDTPVELLQRSVERNREEFYPLKIKISRGSLGSVQLAEAGQDSAKIDSLINVLLEEERSEQLITISNNFSPDAIFGTDTLRVGDILSRREALDQAKFWLQIDGLTARTVQDSLELLRRQQLIEAGERELAGAQALLAMEKAESEARAAANTRLIIMVLLLVVLLIALGYFLREKLRTNALLSDRNKQITDSINYARRIQTSVLHGAKALLAIHPKAVIYNRPQAIVSGDFFWVQQTETGFRLAVVDCTGHGVPGAFMSLIAYQLLENIAADTTLSPAEILEEVHRRMIITLDQADQEHSQDGMEAGLIEVNTRENSLRFAGAASPLWLANDCEIKIYKGSPRSIGGLLAREGYTPPPFEEHEVPLKKGDVAYLFTDGLADQFGGSDGEKLNSRRLREVLQEAAILPPSEQEIFIGAKIKAWQGQHIQPDDQLLVGLRF